MQRLRPVDRLLKIAVAAGAESAVRLHIARGENLEWRDERGFTPLMIAASRDRSAVCELLMDAGADIRATDPDGRDAFSVARDAGASAAAEVIAQRHASLDVGLPWEGEQEPGPPKPPQGQPPQGQPPEDQPRPAIPSADTGENKNRQSAAERSESISAGHPPAGSESGLQVADLGAPDGTVPSEPGVAASAPAQIGSEVEDAESLEDQDIFGDWEPEREVEPPTNNREMALADAARQRQISEHEPIDESAAWDDFEADLPAFSRPIPRASDEDYRVALRRLLLLAAREGSVPRVAIEDALSTRGDAEERDIEAENSLLFALGDMGAEIDERLEHPVGDIAFKLFVEPKESVAEELEVDEALAFFEDLRSGRNDPLRIYLRSINQKALLTAVREVELARAMEDATRQALDILSQWPTGLRRLLAAVDGAGSGPSLLQDIVVTSREDAEVDSEAEAPEADMDEGVHGSDLAANATVDAVDDFGGTAPAADPVQTFARIRELARERAAIPPSVRGEIAALLGSLTFRRPYLARFADADPADMCAEAKAYRLAIADLLSNRDEMTRANLRLVYATARRHVHSGVPLDDLIQEGNIGLMRAVDRFDWRRGFKFSTMATWWIKQQITRSIADRQYDMRLPVHVHEKTSRLHWLAESFERSNGRTPTLLERASMLGVTPAKMEIMSRPGSAPLSIEEAESLGALEADAPADPYDVVAAKEVAMLVADMVWALPKKQAQVIALRYGVGVPDARTLEQVGVTFDLTRERIRQIESKALRKLASAHATRRLAHAIAHPSAHKKSNATDSPSEIDDVHDEDGENANGPRDNRAEAASQESRNMEKVFIRDIPMTGDPSDPSALPSSIRRLLDAARGLGFLVDVQAQDGRARILVADAPVLDRTSRKMVRELLQMGFARSQREGRRK